jgi:amino acid transporter
MDAESPFTSWLIRSIIKPPFQDSEGVDQIAWNMFFVVLSAAFFAALLAFLFKIWRDKVARGRGVREAVQGPHRSRIAVILWFFVFLVTYFSVSLFGIENASDVIGFGSMIKLAFFGTILYVVLFLLALLPAHRNHMPWRRVR